ncbi:MULTISPECIES: CRISPR-associated helicase Cas3' [unclassified Rathayibacter]|uniref:CRISPR-associated helicase Cas3' n=1 Tax=unclassified Rathayibacter TaxID=2609250 RepID=UPI00188B9F00|nr:MULTISPECIES: CRISPR-associated helicase Cas3' [unclassified Rathayibacter]MBF4460958.1 CRISPR-associated helicase Cas3' [Rathayibacter sp. VKM Ac-2879]MBF4502369.1 CRISPR-associated helicase Cas3' [Rathayibacter sp. VKM Ac-2878]
MDASGLSDAAWSVWAKYDRESELSVPLHRHMGDSAAIAELLWDHWLPRQTRDRIATGLGDETARTLAVWAACTHDIGKASPEFARQAPLLAGRMRDRGLAFPGESGAAPKVQHSVIGFVVLRDWLVESYGFTARAAESIAVIAGGHHGVPPTKEDVRPLRITRSLVVGAAPAWAMVREELLTFATQYCSAEDALRSLSGHAIDVQAQALLTSFVIVADWLASNADFFAYDDPRDSRERAADAWERVGLSPPWRAESSTASAETLLHSRFALGADAHARPVQVAALDAARRIGHGLVIIEAPMGEGKTEAALLAAESMASSTGAGGCFVALPTMATSDALFSRVLSWAERLPESEGRTLPQSVFLAHSKADLNPDIHRLRGVRNVYDEQRVGMAILELHQWFVGRKKGVLANFVVGTIDQVLFGALKTKHVALRHLGLANKVVIIDEVHAADAYMSVYLERALAWLGAYGVPVILLSATLAPSIRARLASAYHPSSREDQALLEGSTGYPLLTTVAAADGRVTAAVIPASPRSTQVHLEYLDDEPEALVARLRPAIRDGAAIAVIRNTVARAQQTARELREVFGAERVLLVHSRFIATDRGEREAMLRERLGPTSASRGPLIVVGTQVLEQSLDVDFDVMVTDIAPIDLLLQRAGRLHRHARPTRPRGCERAQLILTGVLPGVSPSFEGGAVAVYGRHLLLRTSAALDTHSEEHGAIGVPDHVSGLVRTVYDGPLAAPHGAEAEWEDAARDWRTLLDEKARNASVFALARPDAIRDSLVGWLKGLSPLGGEDSPDGQKQVRDSEDSIEVLVAQTRGESVHLLDWLPGSEEALPTRSQPSESAARALATSSVRLPPQLCRGYVVDQTIGALESHGFEGWQQSYLLKGQLVLMLDERQEARIGHFLLRYDRADGLEIQRIDER